MQQEQEDKNSIFIGFVFSFFVWKEKTSQCGTAETNTTSILDFLK